VSFATERQKFFTVRGTESITYSLPGIRFVIHAHSGSWILFLILISDFDSISIRDFDFDF